MRLATGRRCAIDEGASVITITDDEWDTLRDGLDTPAILDTVDAVDRLRRELSDADGGW